MIRGMAIVVSLAFSFAPMVLSAEETTSSTAPAATQTAPADPQKPEQKPEVKPDQQVKAPQDQTGDRRDDRRGGENLRPEDTRSFGKSGQNEEQFNKQEEERTKRDEERMKKDDERRTKDDARMKKEQDRQLSSMKKNYSRQAKGISSMRKKITRLEKTLSKCGVGIPKETLSALDAVDTLKPKVDAAKDMDEFQGHMEEMEGHMQTIRESEGQFGMLDGFCGQMLPQAERMLKDLRKTKPLEKMIAKSGDLVDELNELLAGYKTEVEALAGVLAKAKETASSDPQEAMESLQTDFFGSMDTVFNKRGQIEAVSQSKKGVDMLTKQLTSMKKKRDKLAKKEGADVTALTAALEKLEDSLGEIKAVRKAKGDPEEMMEPFLEAFGALEEASEALQELGGGQNDYTRQFMKMMGPPGGGPGGQGGPRMDFGVPSFGGMMGGQGRGGDMMERRGPPQGEEMMDRGGDRGGGDRGAMMDRGGDSFDRESRGEDRGPRREF